ncbi:MAG TPA: hypothetical protein VG826_23060 [Pirellulales bacterium]|nr:hypothetical protein [Pirellulales bacterium]
MTKRDEYQGFTKAGAGRSAPRQRVFREATADQMAEADRALAGFPPERLLEMRRIQGFDTTVLAAIFDSVSHFEGHAPGRLHHTNGIGLATSPDVWP